MDESPTEQSPLHQLLMQAKEVIQKQMKEVIAETIRTTAEALSRTFVTDEDARSIAREAVPQSLLHLDESSASGDTLVLKDGGAQWGIAKAGGLEAKGDKVLYKGVFLREYDAAGVLVAAGSEINPANYATQALYEAALLAAGHTLKPTWDWVRAGMEIGS